MITGVTRGGRRGGGRVWWSSIARSSSITVSIGMTFSGTTGLAGATRSETIGSVLGVISISIEATAFTGLTVRA
jgi:hypothetical protein